MFHDTKPFNQDISEWDVSSVTDMDFMFYRASSFKQTLCGAWLESKASKKGMFVRSEGRISNDKACPDTEIKAIDTETITTTEETAFKPSSIQELSKAVRSMLDCSCGAGPC